MQEEQGSKRRPFHETIVDAIRSASNHEMSILATLIKKTKIPNEHDKIIAAWNQRLEEFGIPHDFEVVNDILEQKQEAANKDKEKVT